MTEFTVRGHRYRDGRMNAFTQFHVTRKLGAGLLDNVERAIAAATFTKKLFMSGISPLEMPTEDIVAAIQPFIVALGKMSDEDSEFIIRSCMAVVERQTAGETGWQRAWNVDANAAMYPDIDLAVMMELSFHVLRSQLSSFFPASGSPTPESVLR